MEKLPAYKKCYNKLKSDIDNNVYPIGSYLPTEDELGKMFSVSRTTVRHAIDLLVKDKRIKVKQGDVYKRQLQGGVHALQPSRIHAYDAPEAHQMWNKYCLLYTSRCV